MPIANGLCLTLVHLASTPFFNTRADPERCTGVADFTGDQAVTQLPLSRVAAITSVPTEAAIQEIVLGRQD